MTRQTVHDDVNLLNDMNRSNDVNDPNRPNPANEPTATPRRPGPWLPSHHPPQQASHLPPTSTRPRPLPPRAAFVQTHREPILALLPTEPGYALCERLTWEVDLIVLAALEDALTRTASEAAAPTSPSMQAAPPSLPSRWALMALGGYGRGQMCLRSDIDIQLVIPDDAPDPLPLMA